MGNSSYHLFNIIQTPTNILHIFHMKEERFNKFEKKTFVRVTIHDRCMADLFEKSMKKLLICAYKRILICAFSSDTVSLIYLHARQISFYDRYAFLIYQSLTDKMTTITFYSEAKLNFYFGLNCMHVIIMWYIISSIWLLIIWKTDTCQLYVLILISKMWVCNLPQFVYEVSTKAKVHNWGTRYTSIYVRRMYTFTRLKILLYILLIKN